MDEVLKSFVDTIPVTVTVPRRSSATTLALFLSPATDVFRRNARYVRYQVLRSPKNFPNILFGGTTAIDGGVAIVDDDDDDDDDGQGMD